MRHPFEKLFIAALRKSDEDDNHVLRVVTDLQKKGYSPKEIRGALQHFHNSIISEEDSAITKEALEALGEEE